MFIQWYEILYSSQRPLPSIPNFEHLAPIESIPNVPIALTFKIQMQCLVYIEGN